MAEITKALASLYTQHLEVETHIELTLQELVGYRARAAEIIQARDAVRSSTEYVASDDPWPAS